MISLLQNRAYTHQRQNFGMAVKVGPGFERKFAYALNTYPVFGPSKEAERALVALKKGQESNQNNDIHLYQVGSNIIAKIVEKDAPADANPAVVLNSKDDFEFNKLYNHHKHPFVSFFEGVDTAADQKYLYKRIRDTEENIKDLNLPKI